MSPAPWPASSLVDEAFEPDGIDGFGFYRQAVAARLPLDHGAGRALLSREAKRCKAFTATVGGSMG